MDKSSNSSLKFGLLMVGVALGILLGNVISEITSVQEEVAYFSMTLICGGISLLIYYGMMKKHDQDNELKKKE
jgi:type III secretory pathway component EscS